YSRPSGWKDKLPGLIKPELISSSNSKMNSSWQFWALYFTRVENLYSISGNGPARKYMSWAFAMKWIAVKNRVGRNRRITQMDFYRIKFIQKKETPSNFMEVVSFFMNINCNPTYQVPT